MTHARHTFKTTIGILICALALGTASLGFAKGPGGKFADMSEEERLEMADKRLDKRVAKMKNKLELSDAQAKKVRAILEQTQAEVRDIRERKSGKEARVEIRKLRKESRTKIKALLTNTQQAKAKGMFKKAFGKRMVKRLKRHLNLTDDQVTKVRAIVKATGDANAKLVADAGGDRKSVRPQLKANRQAAKTKIEALLTKEQKTKFEALEAKRAERRAARRAARRDGTEL